MTFQTFIEFNAQYALLVTGMMELLKQLLILPLFNRALPPNATADQRSQSDDRYRLVVVGVAGLLALVTSIVLHTVNPELNVLTALGVELNWRWLSVILFAPGLLIGNQFWHEIYNVVSRSREWVEGMADLKAEQVKAVVERRV